MMATPEQIKEVVRGHTDQMKAAGRVAHADVRAGRITPDEAKARMRRLAETLAKELIDGIYPDAGSRATHADRAGCDPGPAQRHGGENGEG